MKRCTRCGTEKDVSAFKTRKASRDGLSAACRECTSADDRQRYAGLTAQQRQAEHDRVATYRRSAPGRVARAIWYEEHRPRAVQRAVAWNRAHPAGRREAVRRRRQRMRRTALPGISRVAMAGRWAYYGGRCWVCAAPADQWDHVKPIKAGGPHMLANLRPICGDCNRRKAARWPFNPKELVA